MTEDGRKFTIATIAGAGAYESFMGLVGNLSYARKIVMLKGEYSPEPCDDVELVKYEEGVGYLLRKADVVLLPVVRPDMQDDLRLMVSAGLPVVVHVAYHCGVVKHMKNGYHYQVAEWATYWISKLYSHWRSQPEDRMLDVKQVEEICVPCAEKMRKMGVKQVKRSVVEQNMKDRPWEGRK